jgi:hypothetical protein
MGYPQGHYPDDRIPRAITNNIYAGLEGQFQIRVRFNQAGQIVCLGDLLIDQAAEFFDTMFLQRHPDLEGL